MDNTTIQKFLDEHDYDIRKTHNGRWIDQKCTMDTEYVRWESSTKSVMENIVRKIYFYANNEKYLRTENES